MKSLIAVLVALLLSLQMSWAVAAAYCQHENTAQGAQHLGHHTHDHKDAQQHAPQDAQRVGGKLLIDLDCSFCHAVVLATLPDLAAMSAAWVPSAAPLSMGDARLKSPPGRTPDRPQWTRLA